eukprot:87484_1
MISILFLFAYAVSAQYNYLGCMKDTRSRALRYGPGYKNDITKYTVSSCYSICKNTGFEYFSLQNYGLQCFCDNSIQSITKYGKADNCDGLGGAWSNEVFEIQSSYLEDFEFFGCYNDTPERALKNYQGTGYSIKTCEAACINFKYFAVQAGDQCFCDNDITSVTKYGESVTYCPYSGTGDQWVNTVYKYRS